jgi:23S rRNA (guanosine2251-2'-O)-methyltransferase
VSELLGGRRPVAEALRAGRTAYRLWISRTARPSPEVAEVLALARGIGLRAERVDGDWIRRQAGFDGHQGMLLEVADRRWADPDEILARAAARGRAPFVLILEALHDPTNFGTLLRAAEAAGADGVVFPERGAAPLTAAAVKASAGATEHLLLARVESLGAVVHELKERGVWLVAADQDAPATAWESNLSGPIAVVVGSEGSGVSGAMRRRCDQLVRFPMTGAVASLNAATAGALLLFEVVRQRSAVA